MTRWVVGAVVLVAAIAVGVRVATLTAATSGTGLEVALVLDASSADGGGQVRAAYEAVLTEEGIPHRWVTAQDLVLLSGEELRARFAALVFPDGIARYVPPQLLERANDYLDRGGSIGVVFDAGVVDARGAYRHEGLFSPLLGVDYGLYDMLREGAFVKGDVQFADPAAAARWAIPQGKLAGGEVVGGYAYGGLTYPITRARRRVEGLQVAARAGNGDPVLTVNQVGAGHAMWVGIPLGWVKGRSDDLPLRAIMRTFLIDLVGLPHLIPAPGGVGGLVLSWHIDSNAEHDGVPELIRAGLVRRSLRAEFDVTAGPDLGRPGDGLGLDACGAGSGLVRQLAPYGEIGSHGGWAHDWFADNLNQGRFSRAQIKELIRRNDECLERVTGRPVRSYAAPVGVHPPEVTQILCELGIRSYYYTGDTGSAPNRTFLNGSMVSGTAWAFPVMPNGRYASIGEMRRLGHLEPADVERWLDQTMGYVVSQRTIRLVYSHAYDLLEDGYPDAFGRFLDRVEAAQAAGTMTVQPMPVYTAFLSRLIRTETTFTAADGQLVVSLANAAGLQDVAFAVPGRLVATELTLPVGVEEIAGDGSQRIFVVRSHVQSLGVALPLAG